MSNFWLPVVTLWQRELVRFWRQKSRVLGVVASPLVFWLLIGSGSGDLGRFFAGALVLTVLFSAIFSTISIIEDRREGFLLSMLDSPASRTSLVLGKILGAATLAWIQGHIFLAFAPLAGVSIGIPQILAVIAAVFLVSFSLTGLGFVIAWRMSSTSGFHAIMNLLLVPMWMVSGSLFPMATAHGWIKVVMWANPLTYSISLLNGLLKLSSGSPGISVSLLVTAVFGTVLLLASGASGVKVEASDPKFAAALTEVCTSLAKQLVADGEGGGHVVELRIEGAPNDADALKIAKSIAHSPLVKTAWAGSDPNWGRLMAAVGYSGVAIDPETIAIWFGDLPICASGGRAPEYDEKKAHTYLQQPEYSIRVALGAGDGQCRFWTCDLSTEYVRINAEYST